SACEDEPEREYDGAWPQTRPPFEFHRVDPITSGRRRSTTIDNTISTNRVPAELMKSRMTAQSYHSSCSKMGDICFGAGTPDPEAGARAGLVECHDPGHSCRICIYYDDSRNHDVFLLCRIRRSSASSRSARWVLTTSAA